LATALRSEQGVRAGERRAEQWEILPPSLAQDGVFRSLPGSHASCLLRGLLAPFRGTNPFLHRVSGGPQIQISFRFCPQRPQIQISLLLRDQMLQSIRFDLFLFLFCCFFCRVVHVRNGPSSAAHPHVLFSQVVHVLTSCMDEMFLVRRSYDSYPFTRLEFSCHPPSNF